MSDPGLHLGGSPPPSVCPRSELRPGAGWPSGAGAESEVAGRALHPVSEIGAEAGGGGTVDDVVIDGHGEIEDVPHGDLVTDDAGAPAQASDDDRRRGQGGWSDGEAAAAG